MADGKTRFNVAATEKRPEIIAIAKNLKGVPMCDEYEKMVSGMLWVSSAEIYSFGAKLIIL